MKTHKDYELDPYEEWGPIDVEEIDLSDAEKLRLLADWFDHKDADVGETRHELQDDLRRIADFLDPPPVPVPTHYDGCPADLVELPDLDYPLYSDTNGTFDTIITFRCCGKVVRLGRPEPGRLYREEAIIAHAFAHRDEPGDKT